MPDTGPLAIVNSLKSGGLSLSSVKKGLDKLCASAKQTVENVSKSKIVTEAKDLADLVKEGIKTYEDGARFVDDIKKNYSSKDYEKLAKQFDGDWNKFSEDFDKFYGILTDKDQKAVLADFLKNEFGDKVFSAGSIIKQQTPKILEGISSLQKGLDSFGDFPSNALETVRQIKNGINTTSGAIQNLGTAVGNVFNRVTNELGVNASMLVQAGQSVGNILKGASGMVPQVAKNAYASIDDCLATYDAGKLLMSTLANDLHGKVSVESLSKLASDFNTGWDTFASKVNGAFDKLTGGKQKNILETITNSTLGKDLFDAGSVLKKNLPGVLDGIGSFQQAIGAFSGSYRDPVAAAKKIKTGVDGIVSSTQKVASSIQKIADHFWGDPATGKVDIPVLDQLAHLDSFKPIQKLQKATDILAGGAGAYPLVKDTLDAIKNKDYTGAIDSGKKAYDAVKDALKSKKQESSDAAGNVAKASGGGGAVPAFGNTEKKPALQDKETIEEENEAEDKNEEKSQNDKPCLGGGDSYVVAGATMKCPFGSAQPKLIVLPSRTVFMAGKPMANISDYAPMVNIPTFGLCRTLSYPPTSAATAAALGTLTPMPCVPGTMSPWIQGKSDVLVKGQPALLKSSFCRCQWGGIITLINNGQTGEGTQYVQKVPREAFITKDIHQNNDYTSADIDYCKSEFQKVGDGLDDKAKQCIMDYVKSLPEAISKEKKVAFATACHYYDEGVSTAKGIIQDSFDYAKDKVQQGISYLYEKIQGSLSYAKKTYYQLDDYIQLANLFQMLPHLAVSIKTLSIQNLGFVTIDIVNTFFNTNKKASSFLTDFKKKLSTVSNEELLAIEEKWKKNVDMAKISLYSYMDEGVTLPDGYALVDPVNDKQLSAIVQGINDKYLSLGFHCSLVKGPDGKYILAFRGTESKDGNLAPNIYSDAIGAVASNENLNKFAIEVATSIYNELSTRGVSPVDNLTVTGHSLGGRLSQEVAVRLGLTAVVFNSADLSKQSKDTFKNSENIKRIEKISAANDILSNMQWTSIGRQLAGDEVIENISYLPESGSHGINDLIGGITSLQTFIQEEKHRRGL